MTETPDITPFEPSPAEWEARRGRLVRELRGAPATTRRRRRVPRVALVVAVLVATGAASVGAVELLLLADDVDVPSGIRCYANAPPETDLHPRGGSSEMEIWLDATADPVGACGALWRAGAVDGKPRVSAPPLVACTGEDEPVRVIPGAGGAACRELGLAPLPVDYDALARLQADARAAVEPVMDVRAGCPATAAALFESVRDALAAAGIRGGRVVAPDKTQPMQVCHAEIDARTRTVTVHHSDPVTRLQMSAKALNHAPSGSVDPVVFDARAGCPRTAPLVRALRAALVAAELREWRVLAPEEEATDQTCWAQVDGRARTITFHSSQRPG